MVANRHEDLKSMGTRAKGNFGLVAFVAPVTYGHVIPALQKQAAENIDAGLRAALATHPCTA